MHIGEIGLHRDQEPLIVVELGINHFGSVERAIEMVDEAIACGAKIIKHQTHFIEDEMSVEAKNYIPGNAKSSIYEVIKKNKLSEKDEIKLIEFTKNKGAEYISTPFSRKAVDFLNSMNVPAFKIGSGECNNYPFVEYIAKKNKPVILSTGMNSIESIRPSVQILEKYGLNYALLHCTNIYPTPFSLVRLNAMLELKKNFPNAIIGLSDHSQSISPCLGAIALGAKIIEKHFVLTKDVEGPDVTSSMDPEDLKNLIRMSKEIALSLNGEKMPLSEELATMNFAFASIVATEEIQKGQLLTEKNIWPMRPSGGSFGPKDYYSLIGRRAKNKIKKLHQIKKNDLE